MGVPHALLIGHHGANPKVFLFPPATELVRRPGAHSLGSLAPAFGFGPETIVFIAGAALPRGAARTTI